MMTNKMNGVYIKSNIFGTSMITFAISFLLFLWGLYSKIYGKGYSQIHFQRVSQRYWGGMVALFAGIMIIFSIWDIMAKNGNFIFYYDEKVMIYFPQTKHSKTYDWKKIDNIEMIGKNTFMIYSTTNGNISINSKEIKGNFQEFYQNILKKWREANER